MPAISDLVKVRAIRPHHQLYSQLIVVVQRQEISAPHDDAARSESARSSVSVRLQRLPECLLEHVVFHHIARAAVSARRHQTTHGHFPTPGSRRLYGCAHRQHCLPDAQPAKQINRGRADGGNTHVRLAGRIECRRSRLFNNGYVKSLLRRPQRQCAADTAANSGNFGVQECRHYSGLKNALSLPDFCGPEVDNLHTGHNRTKALQYAACNPELSKSMTKKTHIKPGLSDERIRFIEDGRSAGYHPRIPAD